MKTPTLKEAEIAYLEASRHGFAAGAKGRPVPDLPGALMISHEHMGYSVKDIWFPNHASGTSGGLIQITVGEIPVWQLHIVGNYPAHVIPFLQEALLYQFRRNEFLSGRGPRFYPVLGAPSKYRYFNQQAKQSCFENVSSCERILDSESCKEIGYHMIFGGSQL